MGMTGGGLVRRARPLLGTLVEIAIPTERQTAFEAGFAAISRVQQLMSFHEASSDLGRINRARIGEIIALAPETTAVLRTALELHQESGGIFDIAIAHHLVRTGLLPCDDIAKLGQIAGTMADIEILDDHCIRLHRRALLDLGGIAKGYAVDAAVAALIAAGADQGIVNAGGDMRIFGDIVEPVTLRTGHGHLIDAGLRSDCAIASSENARSRFQTRGSTVTPHVLSDGNSVIIDDLVSVTASTCMIADAMTKVAMIDLELAGRMLASRSGQVLYSPQLVAAA
jgi:FAD:protein FMN transferase